MQHRRLFILIEGNDDECFFDRVIKPLLAETYESIQPWQYAQKTPKQIRKFVRGIKRLKADYIFVGDMDDSPCITAKKEQILAKRLNIDDEKIMIVAKEIESWYLAGLNDKNAQDLTRTTFVTTDALTKENFNSLMSPAFDSRVDFMQEILNYFSVGEAENRNVLLTLIGNIDLRNKPQKSLKHHRAKRAKGWRIMNSTFITGNNPNAK